MGPQFYIHGQRKDYSFHSEFCYSLFRLEACRSSDTTAPPPLSARTHIISEKREELRATNQFPSRRRRSSPSSSNRSILDDVDIGETYHLVNRTGSTNTQH